MCFPDSPPPQAVCCSRPPCSGRPFTSKPTWSQISRDSPKISTRISSIRGAFRSPERRPSGWRITVAGKSTLYNSSGTPQALVVTVPNPGGTSAPTGTVFNGTAAAFNGDLFLFATENGTVAGWRGALGTTAEILFNNSAADAVYKGLAIATVSGSTYLYAADFHNNKIDVFPSSGSPALPGTFKDPNLPAGYAPFDIQVLNGKVYVTYAFQAPGGDDDAPGAGRGFVSVFDLSGNFQQRLVSAAT